MEEELLSKYVAYKRQERGLTQKALAPLLSYTPQAISRFESLNSALPLETADALCEALDCSIDDIFSRNRGQTAYQPLPFTLEEIPTLLKNRRELQGKTREEVAFSCGVSTRSLRNYEVGEGNLSLQFLESFCRYFEIKPSELALPIQAPIEEPPATVPTPIPPRPFYQRPIFAIGIAFAVLVALTATILPIALNRQTASDGSGVSSSYSSIIPAASSFAGGDSLSASYTGQSSLSPTAKESSTIGKYGLDIIEGVPNFLLVAYEKDTFSTLGDTIDLNLSDAYDGNPLKLRDDPFFKIIADVNENEGFDLDYEAISDNQVRLTLASAREGQGARLHISIGGYWYSNIGFFSYRTGKAVYLAGDTEQRYPITRSAIEVDGKNEVNVRLSDTNFVAFTYQYYYEEQGVWFDEDVTPSLMTGDAYLMRSRSSLHNWSITMYDVGFDRYIEIPKQTETDGFMVCTWVRVYDEIGEYDYAMEPLTVHIIR